MVNIICLKNGIRVVMENMPYLRTAAFGVFIHTGSVNENIKNNGISHFIEHMLFKGTKDKSLKDIAEITAKIGDDVNAYTSKEYTCIYGMTTTEYLSVLAELIGDMLTSSVFDKKDIIKEKKVILEEIDMYEDSPDDLVHELLQKEIFKNQSIGYIISGSKKNIRSMKREDILEYKEKYYTAERIVISVAGNFDNDKLINELEEYFGKIKSEKNKKLLPELISKNIKNNNISEKKIKDGNYGAVYGGRKNTVYRICTCTRNKDIEQLHINLAFPGINSLSDEKYTASILNSILGGSSNSRLFQRIREEKGLAYSVYSYNSIYENAGLFHIDITVNPSSGVKAVKEVIAVINELRHEIIDDTLLKMHKSQLKTEIIMDSDNAKARMNINANNVFLYGRYISPDEKCEAVDKVTSQMVNDFANKYLDIKKCSMCLVGPRKETDFDKISKVLKKQQEQ